MPSRKTAQRIPEKRDVPVYLRTLKIAIMPLSKQCLGSLNLHYSSKINFKDCLVTCNACDSYTCSNPQPDTTLNCSALISQCDSDTFGEFMKEKCPATCGKCNRKNANLCADKSKSEVCTVLAKFCNTVDYYDLLSTECPSTCNRCPNNGTTPGGNGNGNGTTACVDVANDCFTNTARCSDATYAPLMHRLCPKTCNSCSNCEDSHKMCSAWVSHGFCTKFSQTETMKKCARSCNLCK
ncbi:hypothetical protein B9Z55_027434 [Caenorhabditis nigoni]|uniref:ShKT domain-containing protein n=1 Tax=Caenorhabditis nigoni TaxID=1611254 RepID=A0A2G5SFG4_9PELO|nr:hypothetical protein B9Z55_027434 [Caenorhabditis nigoni]